MAFQFIRYKHFIKFDFVFNISDLMYIIVNYSAVLLVIVHSLYKKRIETVIYYIIYIHIYSIESDAFSSLPK